MGTLHAQGAQSDIALPKGESLRKVSGAAKDVSILLEMLAWSVPDSGEVGTLWSHTASQPPCMGSQKGEKDSRSISLRQVGPFSRKSCMRPLSVLKGLMQLLPLPKIFLAQFQRAAGV
jgi:hypothetical protein